MIEPLKNKLVIQKDEVAKVTESGFYVPDAAQKSEARKQEYGTIVALGKDVEDVLQVGQKVLFGMSDGTPIAPVYCDGLERCILLMDNAVRAIIQ